MFASIVIGLIRTYQKVKPYLTTILISIGLTPAACRHNPSCSRYTIESIQEYGTISGIIKGLKRIVSCHPFSSPI